MYFNFYACSYYYRDGGEYWETLADLLNKMNGAIKTGELWKKCWNDQKYLMRKAARKEVKIKEPDDDGDKGTRSNLTTAQKLKMFEYVEKNEDL